MARQELKVIIRAKDSFSKTMDKVRFGIGNVGAVAAIATAAIIALTVAVVALAIGMVKATKASIDFNRGMAKVATLIPGQAARIRELKDEVQLLSIETGKASSDLVEGLFETISAFGDTADTVAKLKVAAVSAIAGSATTIESIKLLSAVTKGYGDTSVIALKKVSDLAFKTVELGQTTYPELAASMGGVVSNAEKLNVTQEELFAGFATLTGVTGDTAAVSTQLAGIMRAMFKPTTDMASAIKGLGFSSSESMIKQLGLVGSLRELIDTTDGTAKGVGKLFGRAEALSAVFALTGGQADEFNRKLGEMNRASGATEAAFLEQSEGVNQFEFELNRLKATFTTLLEKVGDYITQNPAFIAAVKTTTNILKGLGSALGFDLRNELETLDDQRLKVAKLEVGEAERLLFIEGELKKTFLNRIGFRASGLRQSQEKQALLEQERAILGEIELKYLDVNVAASTQDGAADFADASGTAALEEFLLQDRLSRVDTLRVAKDADFELDEQRRAASFLAEQASAKRSASIRMDLEDRVAKNKSNNATQAINLLSFLGQKNKAFGIAAIAFEKGLAIARVIINTRAAMAVSRVIDPFGILAADIFRQGIISVGLIAATGIAQIASAGGGGSESATGRGNANITPELTPIVDTAQTQPAPINITINAPVDGIANETIERIVEGINEGTLRNIFINDSAIAQGV